MAGAVSVHKQTWTQRCNTTNRVPMNLLKFLKAEKMAKKMYLLHFLIINCNEQETKLPNFFLCKSYF